MRPVHRRLLWLLAVLGYFALVLESYLSGFGLALIFLTLPWSMAITVLGMLIVHTSSIALDTYYLIGGMVNALLLLTRVFKPYE